MPRSDLVIGAYRGHNVHVVKYPLCKLKPFYIKYVCIIQVCYQNRGLTYDKPVFVSKYKTNHLNSQEERQTKVTCHSIILINYSTSILSQI